MKQRNLFIYGKMGNYQGISTIHSHGTRANSHRHFKLTRPQTELGKASIKFHGAKLWNELPQPIQEERATNSFSNNLKSYLLDIQFTGDTSL